MRTYLATAILTLVVSLPLSLMISGGRASQSTEFVILLQGWGSVLTQGQEGRLFDFSRPWPAGRPQAGEEAFQPLRQALEGSGYEFVKFSYRGVPMDPGGRGWTPVDYFCFDTALDPRQGSQLLLGLTRDIATARPGARVVAVGHSLGGLIAFLTLEHLFEGSLSPQEFAGLVTLDSPLHGVAPEKAELGSVALCGAGPRDLLAAMYRDPTRPQINRSHVSRAQDMGVVVATIGNENDCVYYPPLCSNPLAGLVPWSDDRWTQVVEGAQGGWLPIPIPEETWEFETGNRLQRKSIAGSHLAVLSDPESVQLISSLVKSAFSPPPATRPTAAPGRAAGHGSPALQQHKARRPHFP